MKKKFYSFFDFEIFDWSTWMFLIVNVLFFGNLFLNDKLVFSPKLSLMMWLIIGADIAYLIFIFYQYFKEQYVRFKTRKLRFAMKNGGFTQTVVDELNEIFKRYPINPYHIDIGETQESVRDWAVDTVINHHPYIIEQSFYNIEDAKERERYRKTLRHFDTELFFTARDTYMDLLKENIIKINLKKVLNGPHTGL